MAWGYCLRALAARLDRIQAALLTVEEALQKHEDLLSVHAIVELCEESVGQESLEAEKIAKAIAPSLFQPPETPEPETPAA